jgi:mRNA-degrading endonuclease YafQ of YafQ-DinJ toxin-antitoxin module
VISRAAGPARPGYDLRIVFEFVRERKGADMEIHLLNVGTHDEVY